MFLPTSTNTNYHEIEVDFSQKLPSFSRTSVEFPIRCDQCKVKVVERKGRNCESCAVMLTQRDVEKMQLERQMFFLRIAAYLVIGAMILLIGFSYALKA